MFLCVFGFGPNIEPTKIQETHKNKPKKKEKGRKKKKKTTQSQSQ